MRFKSGFRETEQKVLDSAFHGAGASGPVQMTCTQIS